MRSTINSIGISIGAGLLATLVPARAGDDPLLVAPLGAYAASPIGDGVLSALNSVQGLRITFASDRTTLRPSAGDAPEFTCGLRLEAFGRDGALTAPSSGIPTATGNRVELVRGELTEWYLNDARGLEQSFTLMKRPAGHGDLTVELSVSGTLAPIERDGAIDFTNGTGGVVLHYGDLVVRDADGRAVAARLTSVDRRLRITVSDGDARYPLTIDPLATSPSWTAESNQASAEFGESVATAGDVNGDGFSDVIVGAPKFDNGQNEEGMAFLYLGSANGLAFGATLTVESNQANAAFGISVATAGDVNSDGFCDVIVGADHFDNGQSDEGRAFVYLGFEGGLHVPPAWMSESDQGSAFFGASVATAGDVDGDGFSDVLVGAPGFSNGQSNEGRAFLFQGQAGSTGPKTSSSWTGESNLIGADYGRCVATAGDVNKDGFSDVIAGAPKYANGENEEGAAFAYLGSSSGLAKPASWMTESNQASAHFGTSVATAGDVDGDGRSDVVVGAPNFDHPTANEGGAFLYLGESSAAGISTSSVWSPEGNQAGALFGSSIMTAGDVDDDGFCDIVVGVPFFTNGQSDEGAAFLYLGSEDPTTDVDWTAEGDQVKATFGQCVATAGDVNGDGFSDVVVGANLFDNGQSEEGRAFAYLGSASMPALVATQALSFAFPGNAAAGCVATLGDSNGDGFSDVASGYRDGGTSSEGIASTFEGGTGGLITLSEKDVFGSQANDDFGRSVATAGDVNGDGFTDLIVGAPHFTNGQTEEGRALLYPGTSGPGGLVTSPAWTTESNDPFSEYGRSVATAGDVNGDGFADVLIGAPGQLGRAYAYLGSSNGLGPTSAWNDVVQGGTLYGISVSTAGDENADGFSDVIVGAMQASNGQNSEGAAYLYFGSVNGPGATPAWTGESNQSNSQFGSSVATAGDTNGDGFSDVIIGANFFDNGENDEGRAFLYLGTGNSSGLAPTPAWSAEGDQMNAHYGWSVASVGDVNGDGLSDVIVGAPTFTNGESIEGVSFIYLGTGSGLALTPAWIGEANQSAAFYGGSVASAGDVNGDGFSDVLVGAEDFGTLHEGRLFLYLGNVRHNPFEVDGDRQRRSDDSAPIAFLGRTTTGSFQVKARVHPTVFGRGDIRIAVESKPLGTAFNGAGLVLGSFVDSGAGASDLSATINGLTTNKADHWRARTKNRPTTTPFLPAGPWFSIPGNAPTETDLRTAVCGSLMASATSYGTGKAGTVGVPSLSSTVPPAKGSLSDVTLSGGPSGATGVILFAGLTPVALPFDHGTLLVQPLFIITLPPLNGSGGFTFLIQHSTDPATCGLHFYFQAMFFDPGAPGFYHTAQTNGLDWMIGS